MLNKKEIQNLVDHGKLIINCIGNNIRSASYDVSVGQEYRFSHQEETRKLSSFSKRIKIPKYSLCYVVTKEKIELPNYVSASIHPRNEFVKEGILTYPQPPIDPGYKGHLYILLHNLTNEERVLEKDEAIASIVFHKLQITDSYNGKYQNASNLYDLGLDIKTGFEPFESALLDIENRLMSWKEKLISKYIPLFFLMIAIIIAVLTIIFAATTVPWDQIIEALKSIGGI